MTDINLTLQVEVVINIFSTVICSTMIIYLVVLASSFYDNVGCLKLLHYRDNIYRADNFNIRFDNGTTGIIYLTWEWSRYEYGAGVFATMLVCLFGWVS